MKKNRLTYLFKNTMIFTIGNLATRLIVFFLIPLYTNVLSTSEYGVVDLIITVATLIIPVLTLNIMESVMRFNLDKGVNHNEITKIGLIILGFAIVFGLVLIPVCYLYNPFKGLGIYLYLYCISSAACQIALADLRGKELLVQYSLGNVINTFLIAGFNILFLVYLKLGISGYLLAYIIANTMVAIYALFVGKGYKAIWVKYDKAKMKEMIMYSVVLIPNSFMWWIMNSSDHIMVTGMIGVEANGIYAISYKFPTLISTVTGIFNQAWSYSAIKEEDSEDIAIYTNKIFREMINIIMLVGLGIMTFIKPFLKIYVANNYYVAWKYTPFLIIGCVFLTLGTFMSTSYTVHKDSKGFLLSGTIGAMLNILLNLILIPKIGVYGAAIATCVSYISVFVFRIFHTRKYMVYKLTKGFLIGSDALVVSALLMYQNGITFQVGQIIIFVIVIILFRDSWFPYINIIMNKLKGKEN